MKENLEFIKDLRITAGLPHGAIKEIAESLKLAPFTVSKILGGADGYSSQTTAQVLKEAVRVLQDSSEDQTELAEKISEIL